MLSVPVGGCSVGGARWQVVVVALEARLDVCCSQGATLQPFQPQDSALRLGEGRIRLAQLPRVEPPVHGTPMHKLPPAG